MAASRGYKLFVAKLPWTACRETLGEHFQQFGKVLFSKIIFDYNTGRSKRYGFVEYESLESLKKALAAPDHIIDGSKVLVQAKNLPDMEDSKQEKDFTEL